MHKDPPVTMKIRGGKPGGGKGALLQTDMSATLQTSNDQTLFQPVAFAASQSDKQVQGVMDGYEVRKLTPRECERLMGMPDDWTRIPYRGKLAEECPDGPRYRAIGNSMAVPVMRWIGERIEGAGRKMARMGFGAYRSAIWQIVQECCECGKDDCDEWCMELCEVKMDEVIERIAADVSKAVSGSSDD